MFTDKIQQGSKKLSCDAKVVVKLFMTILVMEKEESIVRMNVPINHMSKLKNEFVHFAVKYLKLIHRLIVFVVLKNVGMQEQKLRIGQPLKNFLDNAYNVEKSSGEVHLLLNVEVVNFVLLSVKTSLKKLSILHRHIFIQRDCGKERGKEFLREMDFLVSVATLKGRDFIFTIGNIKEMVGMKVMKILSLYVTPVTEKFTQKATDFLVTFKRIGTIMFDYNSAFF